MNTSLLKKCLDELSSEKPRLDYMKGILETLIEMSSGLSTPVYPSSFKHSFVVSSNPFFSAALRFFTPLI